MTPHDDSVAAEPLVIDVATPEEWDAVAELLTASSLPLDGAREHLHEFVVARRGDAIVGCAGVEQYKDAGLLRSVAVAAADRGTGTGSALVTRCIADARAAGIRQLVLLTTTARHYFPRFGFEVIERAAVPDTLHESAELRGACPASATVMRLALGVDAGQT